MCLYSFTVTFHNLFDKGLLYEIWGSHGGEEDDDLVSCISA
jgi:hypothetical protein